MFLFVSAKLLPTTAGLVSAFYATKRWWQARLIRDHPEMKHIGKKGGDSGRGKQAGLIRDQPEIKQVGKEGGDSGR